MDALRDLGVSVCVIKYPVDLLVGWKGVNWLIEVKRSYGPRGGRAGRRLTPAQRAFFDSWKGQVRKVHSLDDVLALLGLSPGAAQPIPTLDDE